MDERWCKATMRPSPTSRGPWPAAPAIFKTFYYGNVFVENYAHASINFPYYQTLHQFVKGTYPQPVPLPRENHL